MKAKALCGLLVRLGLAAVVVWVLVSQLQIDDSVVLAGGSELRGSVTRTTSGSFEVVPGDGGAATVLTEPEIRERAPGVPDITYGLQTLGKRLLERPLAGFWVLFALTLVVVLTGWRWQRLRLAVDLPVGFVEAVRLTFVGGFFNLVVPGSTGGDVVKACYAAKRTGRPTRAVLSVFVDRLIGVFTLVVVATGALLFAGDGEGYRVARVVTFSLLGAGTLGMLLVFSTRVRRSLGISKLIRKLPFQRVLDEMSAAIRLYRGRPRELLFAFVISIVNQLTIAGVVWWLADVLSIPGVGLGACFAFVPLINLLSAIPLVPGGWGVGELAFAYFFGQVQVPATEAISLSVIFRLSFLLVNLPGGLLWILMRGQAPRDTMAATVEAATQRVGDVQQSVSPSDPPPDSP